MIDIKVEGDRYSSLTQANLNAAVKTALNPIIREGQDNYIKRIGKRARIPVGNFRKIRSRRKLLLIKSGQAQIWFGVNKYLAEWLGKKRQAGSDVIAGRRRFKNAFLARVRNGHRGVWRRKEGSKKLEAVEFSIDDAGDLNKIWQELDSELTEALYDQLEMKLNESIIRKIK